MATLRRLGREFEVSLPATKSTTVAGVLQEQLQRLPEAGDEVEWASFSFTILEAPQPEQPSLEKPSQEKLLIHLRRRSKSGDAR